jgi:hypothetical protein
MKIENAIENLSFDSKIRAKSSLAALKYVDLMIEDFKVREARNKADILLDVFGLLQGLFVAIDALYQLSFSATKYKYNVNINQNRNLKYLKYLRNDIVGHPTNRNYADGSFGFSLILEEEITKEQIAYITYIMRDKQIDKKKQTILFDDVLTAYENEKVLILKDLENYLGNMPHHEVTTGLLVNLFEKALNNQFEIKDLDLIEVKFAEENNISTTSNHRFLYRLRLIKDLFEWRERKYQDIISYAVKHQILAIYKINIDINNKKARIPAIDKTLFISDLQSIIKKSKHAKSLVKNLNDLDHPLFLSDLDQLIKFVKNPQIKQFLIWFQKLKDRNHSFAIGKIIKDILD